MRKPEALFYDLLKDKGGNPPRPHLPGVVDRVENLADVGMPDISGAFAGRDYWVELKAHEKEIMVETLLRPAQIVWHRRRVEQGSIIFVAARFSDRIVLMRAAGKGYALVGLFKKENNKWPWGMFEATIQAEIKGS